MTLKLNEYIKLAYIIVRDREKDQTKGSIDFQRLMGKLYGVLNTYTSVTLSPFTSHKLTSSRM